MMSMRTTRLPVIIALSATLAVTACAGDPNRRAKIGGGIGTAVGGVVGSMLGDKSGTNTAIGMAVGALAGAGVGHYMDRQKAELSQKLAEQQAANQLSITELGNNTLQVGVASDASFPVDSASLTPNAQNTFNSIANVLKDYDKTAIHVVGFTDSTGSSEHNLQLSQARSQAVAQFLESRGVNSQRVLTWGRGETEFVASNDTEAGRAQNRRVAIIIKPIVEGQEQQAFTAPPSLGNPQFNP
tara:strand:- start:193 stop:918 length:726 start_codon:yes stop_codon:yes gene_type:complete